MNIELDNLSWAQRMALINEYQPSVEQVVETLSVSRDDYTAALELVQAGTLAVDATFDATQYGNIFTNPNVKASAKPVTATRAEKTPKKRGRKGDKVANAFSAIPSTPTPVADFAAKHNVSVAVLRQSKRFDSTLNDGEVRVKKLAVEGSHDKILMIWREQPETK